MTCNVSNDKMVKRCRFFLHKRKILEFIEIVALSRFNNPVVTLDIHRTIPERRVENQNVLMIV